MSDDAVAKISRPSENVVNLPASSDDNTVLNDEPHLRRDEGAKDRRLV